MFLDEISIQTSILIYAGLGFVFFLGLGYYYFSNPIQQGRFFAWSLFMGCIRGLILVSLLLAIFPFKIFENSKLNPPVEYIFVVDFPETVNKDFDLTFRKVDSILKIKHPDLTWIDFKGQVIINFKKPISVSHSLNQLNQTLRKFNKTRLFKEIFILTDGNLNDLNTEFTSNIHLISFGPILNKEQIEFSMSDLPIFSVPGEVVHLPIEVWIKNFKQNKNVVIKIFQDGTLLNKQKILFDGDHTFITTDLELKSDRLGFHQIKVELDNGLSAAVVWNVVKEKAIVYGFLDALDPDVGVLNRVAKNKFIKLIWNFDLNVKIPDQVDKFIFLRRMPSEAYKSRILNSSVLFLNTPKDKTAIYLNRFVPNRQFELLKESLWDLQMNEFQIQGSYAQTDSTIGKWFYDVFLGQSQSLDRVNKERLASEYDVPNQGISENRIGRNQPKLNFLNTKNMIDLLEIDELSSFELNRQSPNLNFINESIYLSQHVYFKLWVLLLILGEWLLRKLNELR